MSLNTRHFNYDPWVKQETARIDKLLEHAVITEIQAIMEGHNYSWKCINKQLRITGIIDYSPFCMWKRICDMKQSWDNAVHLVQCCSGTRADVSVIIAHVICRNLWGPVVYQPLLINLKALPIRTSIGLKGIPSYYISKYITYILSRNAISN